MRQCEGRCTGGQGSKVPAHELLQCHPRFAVEGLSNPSAGAQWNARCMQFNFSTVQYRTSESENSSCQNPNALPMQPVREHQYFDSRSSWSGSTPGHLADREARTL